MTEYCGAYIEPEVITEIISLDVRNFFRKLTTCNLSPETIKKER